jgi:hypothetical protein
MEDLRMAVKPRRAEAGRAGEKKPPEPDPAPKKPMGRPKGDPSTIVNMRIPLALFARLDRYLDRLEQQTGLKANRGMIGRRALDVFLETRATDESEPGT